MQEVLASPFMKWDKEGSFVQGYLMSKVQMDDKMKPGTKQWVYEVELTKPVKIGDVELQAGEEVRIGGRKSIDMGLQKVELGVEVKVEFTESVKSKKPGNNPFKLIKVYSDPSNKKEGFVEPFPADDIPF